MEKQRLSQVVLWLLQCLAIEGNSESPIGRKIVNSIANSEISVSIAEFQGLAKEAYDQGFSNATRVNEEPSQDGAVSVVYFLRRQSDGAIKIGHTTNYEQRCKQLIRVHGPLSLVVKVAGGEDIEKLLHWQCQYLQLPNQGGDGGTEFFRDEQPLTGIIEQLLKTSRSRPRLVEVQPRRLVEVPPRVYEQEVDKMLDALEVAT